MLKPPVIVIFQKLLELAENLHSEQFDGAEFIFLCYFDPKKFWWPPRGIWTPQNDETPYVSVFSKLLDLAKNLHSD